MKFFFLSDSGVSLGLAHRVLLEGNDVVMWVAGHAQSATGDGLVPKAKDFQFDLTPDTIVVCDDGGLGLLCDMFRAGGFSVIGGSLLADRLECDRKYAAEVMKSVGIKTPKTWFLEGIEELQNFADNYPQDTLLVFKPSGEDSGAVPSMVLESPEELFEIIASHHSELRYAQICLQEFKEGIDISTEVWVSNGRLIDGWNHTFESKKLFDGEVGPGVTCAGNVVWQTDTNKVVRSTVLKMKDFLLATDYSGPLDMNAIVGEEGIFALEFTPRFGYDAMPTLFGKLFDGDCGQLLADVAKGQAHEIQMLDGYAGGIRVTVPPYPSEPDSGHKDIKIFDLPNFDDFYPYNLAEVEGDLVVISSCNMAGVALGHGETIKQSMKCAAKVALELDIPNEQHRTDLHDIFSEKESAILQYIET